MPTDSSASAWWTKQDCGRPWGQRRRGLPGVQDPPERVRWTGPKPGAVSVTNTAGWVATDASTPLPPSSPARTRCRASARYMAAQVGQRDWRRFPQPFNTTPSGELELENTTLRVPVAVSTARSGSHAGEPVAAPSAAVSLGQEGRDVAVLAPSHQSFHYRRMHVHRRTMAVGCATCHRCT